MDSCWKAPEQTLDRVSITCRINASERTGMKESRPARLLFYNINTTDEQSATVFHPLP